MIDTIWSYISIALGVAVVGYLWKPILRDWLVKRARRTTHATDH